MVIGDLCDFQRKVKFVWKIKNFLQLSDQVDTQYSSSKFSFSGLSWEMWIYPNGYNKSVRWISLYVAPTSLNSAITVDCSFRLQTNDGKVDPHASYTNTHVFDKKDIGFGCHRFIRRARLDKSKTNLLPSGILTVICTLKKSNTQGKAIGIENVDGTTKTEKEIAFTKDLSEYKVLQDFKELYLKQTDCDVIIRVKGQEFPAHQAFLKARSPVLCSTFQVDMKEKATGVVDIDDCDPSSFSDFLCFLYCGEVENLSAENVFSLFTIADKYDVADLRSQCLKFIKENLTVDTFCDTISLALLHSEVDLIELSHKFFAKNVPNIIVTTKWQVFLAENPTVSNELFIKALASNNNSNEN